MVLIMSFVPLQTVTTQVFSMRALSGSWTITRLFGICLSTPSPKTNATPGARFFQSVKSAARSTRPGVVDIHPDTDELSFSCDLNSDTYQACGHTVRLSIFDGRVKVGWKIDWALRWFTFNVNYEMHGKDLSDSATLSSKICKILGARPPLTYKYELFLDENGAKISKK